MSRSLYLQRVGAHGVDRVKDTITICRSSVIAPRNLAVNYFIGRPQKISTAIDSARHLALVYSSAHVFYRRIAYLTLLFFLICAFL